MTAADEPRVGDLVRLTVPTNCGTMSPGAFTVEGPVYNFIGALQVGGYWIAHPGRTVEILERALPPEPPVGRYVVDRFGSLWERCEGGWHYRNFARKDWGYLLRERGPLRHVVVGDEVR